SRQFFRELTIGTAKPSIKELSLVKHHLINFLSIYDDYNVGIFEKDALGILKNIFNKKDKAIMVGGSGLYIQAICKGFDEVPSANKEVRKQIVEQYEKEGIEYLRTTLKKLDKEHYDKVDQSNPHRMIRAIEVCLTTGKRYSQLRQQENKNDNKHIREFNIIKIGLTIERIQLYEKINARVDEMIQQGLLEEVKQLASTIKHQKLNALNTVGYKELLDYLNGMHTLSRAIELIKQNTRNFAKRQMTWFKKDKDILWFDPNNEDKILEYIQSRSSF
ncbi:MAG TPA: tRNA (adenosine(37)-N6)-dimethylallyltransferase MiaA, partial [Bacteroidia bacterium]|nr:tRNA (adenosine(37)-N6)-dimethylallyltransferase MiaA [Bacteroidia bacterium]